MSPTIRMINRIVGGAIDVMYRKYGEEISPHSICYPIKDDSFYCVYITGTNSKGYIVNHVPKLTQNEFTVLRSAMPTCGLKLPLNQKWTEVITEYDRIMLEEMSK